MGPLMQAVDAALHSTGEEYVLINSHVEMGGHLTKIVGQYLVSLLFVRLICV